MLFQALERPDSRHLPPSEFYVLNSVILSTTSCVIFVAMLQRREAVCTEKFNILDQVLSCTRSRRQQVLRRFHHLTMELLDLDSLVTAPGNKHCAMTQGTYFVGDCRQPGAGQISDAYCTLGFHILSASQGHFSNQDGMLHTKKNSRMTPLLWNCK